MSAYTEEIKYQTSESSDESQNCCRGGVAFKKGNYNLEYLQKLDEFLKLHRYSLDGSYKDYNNFLFSEIVIQDLNLPCIIGFHYFINNDIDNMAESFYNEQKEMKDHGFDEEEIEYINNTIVENLRNLLNDENSGHTISTTKKGVLIIICSERGTQPLLIDDDGAKIVLQVTDDTGIPNLEEGFCFATNDIINSLKTI
tara:strand:+ start:526 stop:1119 length:594 start_codon:yes stop_codon:yes gene_type:complete